jgi:opacity protein-like surface antigen
MNKFIFRTLLASSVALHTQAETTFNYSMLQLSVDRATIGLDESNSEISGLEAAITFSKELENDVFYYINAGAGSIDDSITDGNVTVDIDASVKGIAAGIGKAFALNEKTDVYIHGGVSYSSFDGDFKATNTQDGRTASFSDKDSDISADLEFGLRMYLNQANTIEFSPAIEMTSSNGESSKYIGANLGFEIAPDIQVKLGFSTSIDDDFDTIGIKLNMYL